MMEATLANVRLMPKAPRSTLSSRAQGALVGQIVGDALGSAVDGWSPERIRETYPDGVREMLANPELGTIKGQTTDKSEPAMVLALSLIHISEPTRQAEISYA